jgi:hypothetical protein
MARMSPPTARDVLTLQPTGTPTHAISPCEGLPIFPVSPSGEQSGCPSLRASDEHCVIVRVLRARRMVWLFPSHLSETARCASTGDSPGISPPAGGVFLSILLGYIVRGARKEWKRKTQRDFSMSNSVFRALFSGSLPSLGVCDMKRETIINL